MLKNNKLSRNILFIASYVLLTALFFSGGYYIGFKNGGGLMSESVSAAVVPTAPSAVVTLSPQQYRVILEDGELRLYSDENGTSRLISTEQISEAAFPTRDVALLKEGVIFDSAEEALALMENFLS